MKRTAKIVLLIAALGFAVIPFPLLSQTTTQPKPSFDVVSIKPSAPNLGIRGGGPRGDRFAMSGANLRMLLQTAYGRSGNGPVGGLIGQLQIIGGPNWIDSDRYDIDAITSPTRTSPISANRGEAVGYIVSESMKVPIS